jgi:phenylacetate-CoA ligase
MRNWLLRHLVLPIGDHLYGQNTIGRLCFLEKAQWWSTEQLHSHRDELLRSVIETSYREVPFYRDLMDAAHVQPSDIRCSSDLAKLPVVTKDMLRAGYPQRTTRKTGQRTYEAHTSGSTGKNFAVVEDADTRGWYLSAFLLSLEWAGYSIGDAHLQTGMTLSRGSWRRLKDGLLRCHYVSAFQLQDEYIDQALDTMEHYKIDHLWGYAASLYYFARRARAKGWNRPLRSAVTWGDNLYPHYRREIESAFGTRVTDTYGIGEGIQVSAQCGCGSNYHVHTLDVIVDYLDDQGNPVADGAPGNLILTRLHAGPMPLIRYRVGDVGIRGSQEPCPCGRGFDRMQSIEGRDTDVVLTPSGNRLIVEFFNGIVDDIPSIECFQVVQEEVGSIAMAIVPREDFTPQHREELIEAMKRNGAGDLRIDIECVKELPLTPGGKRRYVISKVPK